MNNNLFQTYRGSILLPTDGFNNAGGAAYKRTPEETLAQYCVTGCLGDTFYANAQTQIDTVKDLTDKVATSFIAKCAIYGRREGYLKDMPALLVAVLAAKGAPEFEVAFDNVIDNGKMLRNFVQVIRSGVLGRKSFGRRIRRKIRQWLNGASDYMLTKAYVGDKPSLADVIKMVRPKALSTNRNAFYAWIIGKPYNFSLLPAEIQKFDNFKASRNANPLDFRPPECEGVSWTEPVVPNVPFQMLTSLKLSKDDWSKIAADAPWMMARMNLNTFLRHKVFEDELMINNVAAKLSDERAISKARAYPYQLMTAYLNINDGMPYKIKEALQDALEIACNNVPELRGQIALCVDVSGSMSNHITQNRGKPSKTRCIDVAALFASAIARRNPSNTIILPFAVDVVKNLSINPRDTIITNAQKMAAISGGGTNCSAPLMHMAQHRTKVDLVIFVSDHESWMDKHSSHTASMQAWNLIKINNKNAKLINIDLTPSAHRQTVERDDIFHIGGFSDDVFDMIADISQGAKKGYFVDRIKDIGLE